MEPKPEPSAEAAELRRHAEAHLRNLLDDQPPEFVDQRSETDTRRLLHELQVHRIELELQNQELQQARTKVEAGLERFTDLYDFAPVGYLTLDREAVTHEANLTVARLLGIERSRLISQRFGSLVSSADLPAFNTFLDRVFEGKARVTCDLQLLADGKRLLDVRLEGAAVASGQECRVAVTDITERRRAEADRLVLSKLESTGILAAGIAHDFNNLLTVILLNLERAQTLVPPGGELAHRLEEVKKAALTSRGLSQQLLTFAGGGQPMRQLTRLPALIQDSAQTALSGSSVRCRFTLSDDVWPAEVDGGQIAQVVRNMVLNAREAMPEGGVVAVRAENVVLGSHEHPTLRAGDYVRVTIADRGSGIAKEALPRIFDPYFSTKQRGQQKGMGLGLTISHTVVRNHGGAIVVESEPGVGTTFHVLLPACRKSLGEPTPTRATIRPGQSRILVMEDEEGLRNALGVSLQQMGYEVELVEEGERAVQAYRNARGQGRPFDAVLLDLTVRGGMGGGEAVRALLEIDPTVKAIVMSGFAHDPVVLEPERHGFQGVLPKPFESDCLRTILTGILGSSHVLTDVHTGHEPRLPPSPLRASGPRSCACEGVHTAG